MKKKILILAGGTATAWQLSKLIKKKFSENFILCIGDINEKCLVPASIFSDYYYQLPNISTSTYYSYMLDLLRKEKIDILVPLIDLDLLQFPSDNKDLFVLNVLSTASSYRMSEIFGTKSKTADFLSVNGILTPKQYYQSDYNKDDNYFVKPNIGFGSRNARVLKGKDIPWEDDVIVQEILQYPEVTVEVFKNGTELKYICRERLEVKSGVCTKAHFYNDPEIESIIKKIDTISELPIASCIQFMKNKDFKWSLTDFNLRLGAGTALSTAAGFDIASAFLSLLSGENDYLKYLNDVPEGRIVLRVYEELVTK